MSSGWSCASRLWGVGALLDGDARADRVGRTLEEGEDAVAQALDDRAAVVVDRRRQQAIVAAPQLVGLLLTQLHAQLGGSHEVGDQHRRCLCPPHRAPFPLLPETA